LPLYPYRCTQCGHRLEKIQSFSDAPLTECPVCDGPLERLLTAPSLQFKGAGWYVNDYAGKGSSSSSESSLGESKPAASESTKSESKPAAPSDSSSSSSTASSSTSAASSGSTAKSS